MFFAMKNKLVISLFAITLSVAFLGCSQDPQINTTEPESHEISALSTHEKVEKLESVKIIDVRTPEEYNEQHLSNSILVPLDTLANEIPKLEDIKKSDEIIVYCRSGKRSEQAYNILKSLGYTNVKSMSGGITAWTSLGYNVCLGAGLTC